MRSEAPGIYLLKFLEECIPAFLAHWDSICKTVTVNFIVKCLLVD